MKRLTALLLVFIMSLTLAACGEGEKVVEPTAFDYTRSFAHGANTLDYTCATEDTVYYISHFGNFIYYIDKESGISGPLCGKPECEHNSSRCNAYVSFADALSIYDGRLYWVGGSSPSNTYIYSAALDGTDRQTVRQIEREIIPAGHGNMYIIFYRGYAYLAAQAEWVTDGEATTNFYVCAIPLDPDEASFVILDEYALPAGYNASNRLSIQPYEDALYIVSDNYYTDSKYELENETQNLYDFSIRRWDMEKRELEILYYEEETELYTPAELWVVDDGILFCRLANQTESLYKYIFDSGEMELLFNLPESYLMGMSDNLLAGGSNTFVSDEWNVIIMDFEGNVLVNETSPKDALDFPDWVHPSSIRWILGADETNAYFAIYTSTSDDVGSITYFAVIAVPLDGSGARLVLSEEVYTKFGI